MQPRIPKTVEMMPMHDRDQTYLKAIGFQDKVNTIYVETEEGEKFEYKATNAMAKHLYKTVKIMFEHSPFRTASNVGTMLKPKKYGFEARKLN